MSECWYEILLGSKAVQAAEWRECLQVLRTNLGLASSWRIIVSIKHNVAHYYLVTKRHLPASLYLQNFLFQPTKAIKSPDSTWHGAWRIKRNENFAQLQARLASKQYELLTITIDCSRTHTQAQMIYRTEKGIYNQTLLNLSVVNLLSVDFGKTYNLTYKKFPKYLETTKIIKLLTSDSRQAFLMPETFPYAERAQFLELSQIDFTRHAFILGGSGTGKSKFIASLVQQIRQLDTEKYQVVVIDPHASLADDLADITDRTVVDFANAEQSIDLFANNVANINVGVELMLGLFRNLISGNFNSHLERVLRYSIYLLMAQGDFGFASLRQLLLDIDYRRQVLQAQEDNVLVNVAQFFLTDFQEIKNQRYGEAIAPIISFVDEMQMLPVFSAPSENVGVDGLLEDTFLNIFSLNRLHLGERVVQVIAGLLFQQLFLVAEQRQSERQLIIIIDEVAVIEHPILARFLSEMRKQHVTVVLAGQYFQQISVNLQAAVLANVTNYYLFRVSRADAMLLTEHLDFKPALSHKVEDGIKLLTDLKLRECLVKADAAGVPLPIFKARTLDYVMGVAVAPKPIPRKPNLANMTEQSLASFFTFDEEPVNFGPLPFIITSRKKLI